MNELTAFRVNIRTILSLLGLLLLGWVLFSVMQVVAVKLFVALILARGIAPVADYFGKEAHPTWRWHPPRTLVVAVSFLVVIVLALTIGAVVVSTVAAEVGQLVVNLPTHAARLEGEIRAFLLANPQIGAYVDQFDLASHLATIGQQALGFFSQALTWTSHAVGAVSGLLDVMMLMLMTLYLSGDGGLFRDYLLGFLPPDRQPTAVRITDQIGKRLGSWVRGQLVLCVVIGLLTWAGLLLLGVPYAALLGIVAGVLEAVPTLGPLISAIVAILLTLIYAPASVIWVAMLCLAIQQIENSVLVPRIMGKSVSLHPLVVLVALLAGQELYGVMGAILSVPIAATVAVVVDEIRATRLALYGTPAVESTIVATQATEEPPPVAG